MPGLRSLIARRRSALGSPIDVLALTPPLSQQSSSSTEESSVAVAEDELSKQIEVNGNVINTSVEASYEKYEESGRSEVKVCVQENKPCREVFKTLSHGSDNQHHDMVNGSKCSADLHNVKETEKSDLIKEQDQGNDGSLVMSNNHESKECRTETINSAGLQTQIHGNASRQVNRSAMEIESTLAKRGVTIVRKLVNVKDQIVKSKSELTQVGTQDSLVLNGTVITANPQIAGKNNDSRLGKIASSLKGTSITLNSRGFLGLRGGATVNRNPVGRPPNNLRDFNQRATFKSRGTPAFSEIRGHRYQAPGNFHLLHNVKGMPSQSGVGAQEPQKDIRRGRVCSTDSSGNNAQRTTTTTTTGTALRGPIAKGSSAYPSPKSPGDFADTSKSLPYASPKGCTQAGSPQAWSSTAGSRSFAKQQRPATPSNLRITLPSPQLRSSAIPPHSSFPISPPCSAISPHSNTSIPSPQSKASSNYQARSTETSPYSRAHDVSPVSRSAEASPPSRVPELSPSSRSTEVSPLSRTSDLSPLSRSVEASPQHRSTGIAVQSRFPVEFSPRSRTAEFALSSRQGTLGSQPSYSGGSPQSHMAGLSVQSLPIGMSSALPTAAPISTRTLHADSVCTSPQSTMDLLTQPANSSGLTQEHLPYGQTQHSRSVPEPSGSVGYTGLSASSNYAVHASAATYITSDSSKFPVQPNLEGFPSPITPGSFPMITSPGNFPAQPDLHGYSGFQHPTNGRLFATQNTESMPDQLNPQAFSSQQSCTSFNQANSGYPPPSSGEYGILSNSNEYQKNSSTTLGIISPRPFPLHANSQDYTAYSNSENTTPREISSHTSPGQLTVSLNSREVMQSCSQGISVDSAAGVALTSVDREPQLHSNYNENLVHRGYEQNAFPRSSEGNVSANNFRESSHNDYSEPSAMLSYRAENIPNSFRTTPLQDRSRATEPISSYRELSLMSGINDVHPQTSPGRQGLHNNYRQQTPGNSYREHEIIGNYGETSDISNYRESVNQTDQTDQPLLSPREQILPVFRETSDRTSCREQLLPAYRETLENVGPREQVLPTFNENVNHKSPRGESLPNFNETMPIQSHMLPVFNETVNHQSSRMQTQASYRKSVDYNNFQDQIDQVRESVHFNCNYSQSAQQPRIMEPPQDTYSEFRNNQCVPIDNTAETIGSNNSYRKSVLPSFTESFECGNSNDYNKDTNMLQNFPESSSYVPARRNSECSSFDGSPFSSCQQISYPSTYTSEQYSPERSFDENTQSQQRVDDKLGHCTSEDLVPIQSKIDTSNDSKEGISDGSGNHIQLYTNAGISNNGNNVKELTDLHEKHYPTKSHYKQEKMDSISTSSDTKLGESNCERINILKESNTHTTEVSSEPTSFPSSSCKFSTIESPSKLSSGLSPSSQERIIIKMKLLHSNARHDSEKYKKWEIGDENNMNPEQRGPSNYSSVKYTRWTIDSIINGREEELHDKGPGKKSKSYICTTDEEEEESSQEKILDKGKVNNSKTSNLDTNKNLMKPLKITIPNPLRTRSQSVVTLDSVSPSSKRITRKSSRLLSESEQKHEYPIRKLRVKATQPAPSSIPINHSLENHTIPVSASLDSYTKRRRRKSKQNSEFSNVSLSSMTSEDNDQSMATQMKKCSIVIKRIYSAGNNSCYSSRLCSRISTNEKTCGRPKRKAAVEASERCHKSLRSNDKSELKSNRISYNGAFCKSRQLMSVNMTSNDAEIKKNITQCSVILYDVFMNRRINSMNCPGCSRNYDSSDSVQVNISKATISLLCSMCQWLVVKDVHPHEVHSVATS